MTKNLLKIGSILLIAILIANMVFLVLGKINWKIFWLVILIAAVIAYKVLPRLGKRSRD